MSKVSEYRRENIHRLVALTLADSMARGSSPSEDHVRALVRLLR